MPKYPTFVLFQVFWNYAKKPRGLINWIPQYHTEWIVSKPIIYLGLLSSLDIDHLIYQL